MRQQTLLSSLIFLSLSLSPLAAANIYKSIDEDGSVSFSDQKKNQSSVEVESRSINTIQSISPPEDAERTEDDASLEEEQAVQATNRKETIAAAQKAVRQAQIDLEKSKEFGEGDRLFTKTTTGGFTRESSQYKERVAEAEAKLEEAKKALSRARRQ